MTEGAKQAPPPPKKNLRQLTGFVEKLVNRCVLFGAKDFAPTHLFLSAAEAGDLEQVAQSMAFFTKHEARIKEAAKKWK